MEWLDPINPFNSLKVLRWIDHLERFHAGEAPPPITVDIEPTNACNLNCGHCYPAQTGFRKARPSASIAPEVLLQLPQFLRDWGVQSIQVTGGGEPMFHPQIFEFLDALAAAGMPYGLITNGTALSRRVIEQLARHASWVGVSVDAATPETWALVKGSKQQGLFEKVIYHLADLVTVKKNLGTEKRHPEMRVAFKFLCTPQNAHEVVTAAKLAVSLGVDDFHMRAAYGAGPWPHDLLVDVHRQLDELHGWPAALSGHTRLYTVQHKLGLTGQTGQLAPCRATPLLLSLCADGRAYVCQDHRGEDGFCLGSFEDLEALPALWGGPAHRAMLQAINPANCWKCTFCGYNQVVERISDLMPEYL